MSDIVERLRVQRSPMWDGERVEAADEIERLRSDLDAMEKKRNTASVNLMEALAENERLGALVGKLSTLGVPGF